jgi:hypothetical protein
MFETTVLLRLVRSRRLLALLISRSRTTGKSRTLKRACLYEHTVNLSVELNDSVTLFDNWQTALVTINEISTGVN